MKKLIALVVMLGAISASAASHQFASLLVGPTAIVITNNGSATPTVLGSTVSTTTLGGGGALTPFIAYTNTMGTGLLANTNWFYYITNTVAGDTTDTGWRTNFTTINNGGPFVDVPIYGNALGDATELMWSLVFYKAGSGATATNAGVFSLYRSFDGVNFQATATDSVTLSTLTAERTTATTVLSTNLPASWLAGVKAVRFQGVTFASAPTGTTSTFTLLSSGISGFKP